jgi:hypothetical protein
MRDLVIEVPPTITQNHQCQRKDENRLKCTSNARQNNFAALALGFIFGGIG